MKLQPDRIELPTLSGYGPGWLGVGPEKITHSLILGSAGQRMDWNCRRFDELTPAHFELLATLDTELVIFGSGQRLRFPPTPWLRALIGRRIGLETMDTGAACRTYNILAGEGRSVVAALLLEQPS
ncbi:MAG: Mth938-like domain-containing protein [Burkholderiaceae bacterium]|nr:Mth938-like domain-containing protein [Burkholderiaceae bacterium]